MNRLFLSACVAVVLSVSGCVGVIGVGGDDGGTGGGSGSTGGGGGATGGGSGSTGGGGGTTGGGSGSAGSDIPCEVVTLVQNHCASCHGNPTAGGAPFALLTHADFAAMSPSFAGQTEADRSLARMQAGTMPPGGGVPASLVTAFQTWVTGGLVGTCGSGVDAGSTTPTCASGTFYPQGQTGRSMAPGLACIACHQVNQPDAPLYQFMGTVFASAHEQDYCRPSLPTAALVDIFDSNHTLVTTLTVNSGGNFYGSVASMPSPYTAAVRTSAGSRAMGTPQTNGDCNSCHTVGGASGTPGRIYLP